MDATHGAVANTQTCVAPGFKSQEEKQMMTESLTYEYGSERSYFADVAKMYEETGDSLAKDRLLSHASDVRENEEFYQLCGERSDYAVPPLWFLRKFRSSLLGYASVLNVQSLPWNFGAVQEPVVTVAGQQDFGYDKMRKSPLTSTDEAIFKDLAFDLSIRINQQVVSGAYPRDNQVVGISNTPGIRKMQTGDPEDFFDAIESVAGDRSQVFIHPRMVAACRNHENVGRVAPVDGRLDKFSLQQVVEHTPADNIVYVLGLNDLSLSMTSPRVRVLPEARSGKVFPPDGEVHHYLLQLWVHMAFKVRNPSRVTEITGPALKRIDDPNWSHAFDYE